MLQVKTEHDVFCTKHIEYTYIIKEHINSIGTGLLKRSLEGADGLIVVCSIKANRLQVFHFSIATSKT